MLLGKLSTHEFAHGGPSFDLPWPPARNPWNRDYFTGGSSSGSGAAVAAGLAMAALGSDTGGSIRNPAALCGLIGLKPTYGLISRGGVYTNSFSYDTAGPMTWTAEDCAILLGVIAGHDSKDPASSRLAIPDYRSDLRAGVKGLRIGVLRHLYESDVDSPAVSQAAMGEALDVFRSLGATIEHTRIRPAMDYYDVKIVGAESELYAVHEPVLRQRLGDFGEDFLGRSLGALLFSGIDYVQASRERRAMIAEMAPIYERYDLLLTLGPGPAPRLDAHQTINFWRRASLTTPFNVLGGPAVSQCIGFSPEGLPLAMQIVGRPFDETTVLRAAQAYENATSWRCTTPCPRFHRGVFDCVTADTGAREGRHQPVRTRQDRLHLPPSWSVLERAPFRAALRDRSVHRSNDKPPEPFASVLRRAQYSLRPDTERLMPRITELRLPLDHPDEALPAAIRAHLGLNEEAPITWRSRGAGMTREKRTISASSIQSMSQYPRTSRFSAPMLVQFLTSLIARSHGLRRDSCLGRS